MEEKEVDKALKYYLENKILSIEQVRPKAEAIKTSVKTILAKKSGQ